MSVLPTVDSGSGETRLYLSNFRRLDMGNITSANVTVQLHGLKSGSATVTFLDDNHLTAVEVWKKAGRSEG